MIRASACVLLLGLVPLGAQDLRPVVIGSKNFTESGVLAELMAQMIEAHTDLAVQRRINLGGTMICWSALQDGEIDVYAEYTGTAWSIVLKEAGKVTDPLRAWLHVSREYERRFDIRWLQPFGLDNTYALAMQEELAQRLGIERISDLAAHADEVRAGFSVEFMNREDGYPGLSAAYGFSLPSVRTLEHGLAYTAIRDRAIDLIDAYSTDAKLLRYGLRVLEDDRRFFPPYNAAPIVRGEVLAAHPELETVLDRLAFQLSDATIQRLNFAVEEENVSFADAARGFLEQRGLLSTTSGRAVRRPRQMAGARSDRIGATLRLAAEHIGLTLAAVLLAAFAAIPLGIAITRRDRLRRLALGVAGVLQTIPSLALLAFLIPLLGLGVTTAVAALFLYAVLPILRNTYTGIVEVDPALIEAARGMGMRDGQILRLVQLPLATRTIMAGIRTATVISVGIATLAAFIGAGGLGQPIVTGLYLDDTRLILWGAVPAALLAVLADLGLGGVERWLSPRTRSA